MQETASKPLTEDDIDTMLSDAQRALHATEKNPFTLEGVLASHVQRLVKEVRRLRTLIGEPPAGSHPDEQYPRAGTWHAERLNWLKETEGLREYIRSLNLPPATLKPIETYTPATNDPISAEAPRPR